MVMYNVANHNLLKCNIEYPGKKHPLLLKSDIENPGCKFVCEIPHTMNQTNKIICSGGEAVKVFYPTKWC